MTNAKLFFLFFLFSGIIYSQKEISGKVFDPNNLPLPGANIVEKGTTNGAATDFDGLFSLTVKEGATLVVSFSGFETTEVIVGDKSNFKIVLKEGMSLNEIIITGSRIPARSNTSSPLPVDIVAAKELQSTGQQSFDKALQYKIPSFNTVQTPVNDATSLLDPYEIRNMGPSRTLILINGKRKNLSSLLYTQTSPGIGETGADISAIPLDAIKSIQILRDGASAQYGSDAIAGVMNVILKDDYKNSSATFRTGTTIEGDGESIGVSYNGGTALGEDEDGDHKGFINYTVDFSKSQVSNRPGTVDAFGEFTDFGGPQEDGTINVADSFEAIEEFLSRNPDANNINGSPEKSSAKFLINGGFTTAKDKELYFNAAYVFKKVNSFANYRTPYWRDIEDAPYLADLFPGANGYDGYLPTFVGDLNDYNATLGIKGTINEWNSDVSITVGGNSQTYTVSDSHNSSNLVDAGGNFLYRENTPISFQPGGTSFNHVVGNLDLSRVLSDKVSVAIGTEYRAEFFEILEGDLASYDGVGSDSFAGNTPEDSGLFSRYNIGGYVSASYDATEDLLFEGTVRGENYSDFGTTFVWKASSRYKFLDDRYTIRASASTGFKAPSLHQIYTQKSQFDFEAGGGITVSGIVNNVSPEARRLGVASLKAEESLNFTVGIGAKPIRNLSLTLDYYNIDIDDRIFLSRKIDQQDEVDNGFLDPEDVIPGIGAVQYFSNELDSRTSGIDVVIAYSGIHIGEGKLGLNLSGNYTFTNERTDNNTGADDLLDESFESLLFTSRPVSKWIFGANYRINKFEFNLGNTYFGKATFNQDGLAADLKTEFIPKIVTDLGVTFNATEKITIAANINNIFNILPEWEFVAENAGGEAILADPDLVREQSNLITFNQRYAQTTYDGYHFSQLGTLFNLSLNYAF